MSESKKPNVGFWVISSLAVIWNLMGVDGYLNQTYKTERFKSMYSEEQLEIIFNSPAWVTAAFAMAVFSSVLAGVLLLLRKKSSKMFFVIGLLAVIVQTVYNVFMNPGIELYGSMEYSMLTIIPLFSVFLVWYSRFVDAKGWLSYKKYFQKKAATGSFFLFKECSNKLCHTCRFFLSFNFDSTIKGYFYSVIAKAVNFFDRS